MPKIKDLEITNFRGFDHIKIEGFSDINIFLGSNSCGKTTVLESLIMVAGVSNSLLIFNLNQRRTLNINNKKNIKSVFYNLDWNNHPILISHISDSETRKLEFCPVFKDFNFANRLGETSISSLLQDKIVSLSSKFTIGEKSFENQAQFGEDENVMPFRIDYKETLDVAFINSGLGVDIRQFENIIKTLRKEEFIAIIRNFDDRITSIESLDGELFFQLEGFHELLQVGMMGDGIRNIFHYLSAIFSQRSRIVLIDEIENGLHFSAHKKLWESIIKISKLMDVQLFITTHSLETIKCLSSVLEESDDEREKAMVKMYTIAKTATKGFQSYGYSYEGFSGALETEIEIRK